ncbi:putative malate:quinone oxidoreductase [Labeo rohita]|uniref:Malate:quinone oxidoreductase n=1 Tax=Labeo rohita TaxID=84645 RepID=A0ABQ8MHK1_LABRO|nr:putative malate:quinone oxidoreductase [Labeo rohita]
MSTMVVQERHLWLNLAEMRDAKKVRFLEPPISQAGLFGETVEEFAQQFSMRALAQLRLLRTEGGPLPVLQLDPPYDPVLAGRWHRQPVHRPQRTLVRLQSIPETGSPGKEDRLTCPGPHSTRGHSLPAISYFGASTDSGLCMPFTFPTNPIIWPILCHDRFRSEASGGSTPQSVQLIWNLFASPESTYCQLWYGLTEAPPRYRCTGAQLAEGPAQIHVSPSEPHCTNPVQSQGGQGADSLGAPILAQQNLVFGPGAPSISPSLAHSSEEGPPLSGEGHNLAPAPRSLEPPPMVPGRDQEDFRDLSPSVVNTLLQARAPSTRRLHDLKWRIFVNWCSSRGKDPQRCGIESVLSFLQGGLDRHLSASTLKVHVEAISANHDLVDDRSVGKHHLVIRFLRGARILNPTRPHLIPSWDLTVVLQALQQDPFESVELNALSLKGGSPDCAHPCQKSGRPSSPLRQQFVPRIWASGLSRCLETPAWIRAQGPHHSLLRPGGDLASYFSLEDDPNLTLLCPVCALRMYLEHTQPFRRSEQLFVCYGGQQKGKAVSKQRISHWLVDAIRMAYQARGLPCPLGVRAHSTRGVAASAAFANGASLTDICKAAGWATPNTFARFYNLRMEPVSARVLNASL